MTRITIVLLISFVLIFKMTGCADESTNKSQSDNAEIVFLPSPQTDSDVSIESVLKSRRSLRNYSDKPVSLEEVSQLLWAAQGITGENMPFRTAPSAGATYPLETYVIAGNIEGLEAGVYKYNPQQHQLQIVNTNDVRSEVAAAGLGQAFISQAPLSILFTAIYSRTTNRYGQRGNMYVHMEAGHAAQNICLQAEALNMGAVPVGAFNDDRMRSAVGISDKEKPLYLLSIGKK